uniref:ABC transporter domain-containing protein n=1 Tax=Steinernema glaseri TaxID=37863 RepID=A0A1I8AHX8_9BILA
MRKHLIVMRRRWLYTVFELGCPLLALPLVLLLLLKITDSSQSAHSFEPLPVSGTIGDLSLEVEGSSSIMNASCKDTLTILYCSKSKEAERLMNSVSHRYAGGGMASQFPVQKVPSVKEMLEILREDTHKNHMLGKVCTDYFGGIEIQSLNFTHPQLKYHVHLALKDLGNYWSLNENWNSFIVPKDNHSFPSQPPYWASGIISIQRALDDVFLENVNGSVNVNHVLQRAPSPAFPYPPYIFVLQGFPLIGVLLTFGLIHTTTEVLMEKESGMKAYLTVMGLREFTFQLSHWSMGFLKAFVPMMAAISPILVHLQVHNIPLLTTCLVAYAACVSSFSILMASIFRSSSTANKVLLFIWPLSVAVIDFVPSTKNRHFYEALMAINPTKALSLSIYALVHDETGGMECGSATPLNFTVWYGLIMLVVTVFWMLLLASYLESVFPFGDTPGKSPLFFIEWLWRRQTKPSYSRLDEEDEYEAHVEYEFGSEEADICIEGLTKVWDKSGERAVDGFHLNAYKGQARHAKVATLSQPSDYRPTWSQWCWKVDHIFNNHRKSERCRELIGYCPQTNPLFNYLTVNEHLWFFQSLKSGIANEAGVEHILREMDLLDKKNELAKSLSGGMKRKLCVGMALVGDSRVILLDEPTAGMDLTARKNFDEVLTRNKWDRTFLVTTHYMDEADRLGDRIAIMVKGRLACAGSPDFLKHRYGAGYLLSIECSANYVPKAISVVKKHVPTVSVEKQDESQVEMLLPMESRADGAHTKFVGLFEELEGKKGVKSFGLSLNSMEKIFLRVNEEVQPYQGDVQELAERQAGLLFSHEPRLSGPRLWVSQLLALLNKRRYLLFHNPLRLIFRILLPFHFALLIILFLRMLESAFEQSTTYDLNDLGPISIPLQMENSSIFHQLFSLAKEYPNLHLKRFHATDNLTSTLLPWMVEEPPVGIGYAYDSDSVAGLFNGQASHSPILVQNFFTNAAVGVKGAVQFSLSISASSVTSKQFLMTKELLMAIVLVVQFSEVTSGFVMYLVEERQSQFKHQQLLTGVHITLYCLSTLVVDFFIYLISCALTMAMLMLLNIFEGYFTQLLLLFALYFFCSVPFVYSVSFLFQNKDRAYNMTTYWNSIVSVLAIIAFSVAINLAGEMWTSMLRAIFAILLPSFAFGGGLLLMALYSNTDVDIGSDLDRVFIYMAISGALFWTLLSLLQSKRVGRTIFRLGEILNRRRRVQEGPERSDQDVLEEEFRMEETEDPDVALSVRGLNKYYGRVHAVKDLTFGVKKEECFGLLGVNGAGKTSTFDVIAGAAHGSSGSVSIAGTDASKGPSIGYCPQFDALRGDLTARQTLEILSRLHGFKETRRRVANILECVGLEEKANKPVKSLSGGQKRRLSVGLALLGQKSLVLLDEPTAGIDPKARRSIWNLLVAAKQHDCAILLTSHSMAECEALCGRVGFMHHGKLMRIGTTQHLKSRFGCGYQLSLTVENPSLKTLNEINKMVFHEFGAKELDVDPNTPTYYWEIPKRDDDTWSALFKKLDLILQRFSAKSNGVDEPRIIDSALTQNSLEQIFERFAQAEGRHDVRMAHGVPRSSHGSFGIVY